MTRRAAMAKRPSAFAVGERVRLVLPGSKLNGVEGVLKHPKMPSGWWLVEADAPIDQQAHHDGSALPERCFSAPESWLRKVHP